MKCQCSSLLNALSLSELNISGTLNSTMLFFVKF
jgi:hypothetical protein